MTAVLSYPDVARRCIDEQAARGLLIDGGWSGGSVGTSGASLSVLDPGTGAEIAALPEAGESAVASAVDPAGAALPGWRGSPGTVRAAALQRLADQVEQDGDVLAILETIDNGKPLSVSRGHDLPNAVASLRYFAGLAATMEGRIVEPVFAGRGRPRVTITREPVGVVAALVSWNAPLMTAVWKLAPALAAGNTVVLKPAEDTCLSALRLGELTIRAGFPPGVVNIVTGQGRSTGAALAKHPDVRKISFTGSTEVGRILLRQSATDFRRVGLELGGKSAAIVFADAVHANVKKTINGALWAIFANSGQVCSAGSRLLVERAVYDETLERLVPAAERIRVGHGLDAGIQMGPLISQDHLDRVRGFIEDADLLPLTGGAQLGRVGFFLPPTIFSDVDMRSRMWREEIFGPVLCVVPFDDLDHAVEIANDSQYGLAAGIFSEDEARVSELASRLDVGTVWANTHNQFDPAAPWGGLKCSDVGKELGSHALDSYTEEKVVWRAG